MDTNAGYQERVKKYLIFINHNDKIWSWENAANKIQIQQAKWTGLKINTDNNMVHSQDGKTHLQRGVGGDKYIHRTGEEVGKHRGGRWGIHPGGTLT